MALTNILICTYNNYYNRTYKKAGDLITDYTTVLDTGSYDTFEHVNFYKGDYVNSELVLNTTRGSCDYLIEFDTSASGNVLSRWFIIENMTTRGGQSKFILRRDVFVDYRDKYLDAPAYIEKATVPSINDVAIYNQEPITFNEIKTDEHLLKDGSQCPWIIGYVANNISQDYAINADPPVLNLYGTYESVNDFYEAIGYNGTTWRVFNSTEYTLKALVRPSFVFNNQVKLDVIARSIELGSGSTDFNMEFDNVPTGSSRKPWFNTAINLLNNSLATMDSAYVSTHSAFHLNKPTVDGVIIKIDDGETAAYYLKVSISQGSSGTVTNEVVPYSTGNGLYKTTTDILENGFGEDFQTRSSSSSYDSFFVSYTYDSYTISTESYTATGTITTNIKQASRNLLDAPYKMFAIPVNLKGYIKADQFIVYNKLNLDEGKEVATEIAKTLGTNVYDIQLLPYSPVQDLLTTYTSSSRTYPCVDLTDLSEHTDFEKIMSGDDIAPIGVVIFPKTSNFTFDISYGLTCPSTVVNKKIENQCTKYRLCSPNYSSIFEFNLVKTGSITKFNVDCTYKPYSPYIHVNPDWNGLYGEDYDDARGLIYQGDFSLPIINDQWKQYQINQKNYLNAFNREIDSIELNNKYAKVQDVTNAITGTGSGAVSGAVVGSIVPGIGTAAGAVIGGLASGGTGIADVAINEKLRNEALDLRVDQFNMNIQNIKALPNTLSRVSSFDYNNKIFTILEYYTCTSQEKQIFKDKMAYNGMTINRVGTVSEFLQSDLSYIKGQFIKLPDMDDDYHCAKCLAEEFYKGVWM